MRNICVYCGSSPGADPAFTAGAKARGRAIAETDRAVVYGGAKVGLMGALADAALAAGGKVIGVLPRALVDKGVAHDSLTELPVVASTTLSARASFVSLPILAAISAKA